MEEEPIEYVIPTIYVELGYEDRYHYFETLAETFLVPTMKIILKAEELGIEQDFEGLLDWLLEQRECFSTNTHSQKQTTQS